MAGEAQGLEQRPRGDVTDPDLERGDLSDLEWQLLGYIAQFEPVPNLAVPSRHRVALPPLMERGYIEKGLDKAWRIVQEHVDAILTAVQGGQVRRALERLEDA